jgi:hypothetical protein
MATQSTTWLQIKTCTLRGGHRRTTGENIQVFRPDGAGRYCVSGAGWHTFLLIFLYTSICITDIAHSQTTQGTAVLPPILF